jgi:hypothetical protein
MTISTEVNSRRYGGWRMSAEEERTIKGSLLAEYVEAREGFALLEEKARSLAKDFLGLSTLLNPDKIWNISLESYEPFLSKQKYDEISKLKVAIEEGGAELSGLRGKIDDLGLGHLFK